ncbi:glycosyltransferase [Chloroflexia bacterium SDU3-3]|nr:glycosyltransferase [Chloroflexia bacterium SDU3-3]
MEFHPQNAAPPSILFAISDTGGGHRSGAQAIDTALQQISDGTTTRHIVDILASTNLPIMRDAPDLYDSLSTRWLPLYDHMFALTNGTKRMDVLTHVVYVGAHRSILRVLEETRPTLVVSVHPLLNRLIGNARRTYKLSFRFVSVVTDLVSLHAAWADPSMELTMVPTQEAYQRMLALGVPEEKLQLTGFPVSPKFTQLDLTPQQGRQRLGLDAQPFTILLTAGGVGSGNLREMVLNLVQSYPQHQLLVVTGKNAALREELEKMQLGPLVRIFGFVSNMEELMSASDIIVTKAGPGTLMEALVMRRPVIVTAAVGAQEQGNIDFVLNHELGAYCPTPDRVGPAVAELMQPEVYAATIGRLHDAVPRNGAVNIASTLVEQLKLAPPPRRRLLMLPSFISLNGLRSRRLPLPVRLTRKRLHVRLNARALASSVRTFPYRRRGRNNP